MFQILFKEENQKTKQIPDLMASPQTVMNC